VRRAIRVAACAAALTVPCAGADAAKLRWVTGWEAAPHGSQGVYQFPPPELAGTPGFPDGFRDQSLRQVITPHAKGLKVRVVLSNVFGTGPVTIADATVARRTNGPAVASSTLTPLRFDGRRSATIRAGEQVRSDPAEIRVRPFKDVAVSLAFDPQTGPPTYHYNGLQTSYVSPLGTGDQARSADGAAYTMTTPMRFFITDLQVRARAPAKTVVAVGDSITDGGNYAPDTADKSARWPDFLQRRLLGAGSSLSLANAGISANQAVSDAGPTLFAGGPSLEHRFDRDVLSQPHLRGAILLEGINDIGLSSTPAGEIIAGYERIAKRAHAAGVPIVIGTLTPMSGAFFDSPAVQQTRQTVNDWIRTQRVFDRVIDFAPAIQDPAEPTRILPQYDSGDHLHPNAAGLRAMSDAIPLGTVRRLFGDRRHSNEAPGYRVEPES
jgi:lysophospholipase L1-like esterase